MVDAADISGKGPARACGLFNVYKPPGISSRRVVDHVQRLVVPAKAGHAGTLDPLATGVLIVCVGPATRLIEYVQRLPKRYLGTFLLGRSSPTEDVEGEVEVLDDAPQPVAEQLEAALAPFRGSILQRPPVFSALKVAGRRAYELARQGKEVELAARPVTIHALRLVSYNYPEMRLDIECSSGTYVRSLARDIAASLGTAAVMSALERTAIGPFLAPDAIRLDNLTTDSWRQSLLPARMAAWGLPECQLTEAQVARVACGLALDVERCHDLQVEIGQEVAGLAPDGSLAGILVRRDGELRVHRNLVARG